VNGKIDKDRIWWIPNGINLDLFNESRYDLPHELSYLKENKKFNVVYTGSLGNVYGLESLIDAARLCANNSDIFFTLVGDGALRNRLRELANKNNLENINFIKPVEKKFVPGILRSSDLLYASMKEKDIFKYGVSLNKLQEYMFAKKPIVFSCASCLNNPIAQSGSGIIANNNDPKSIFNAIIKIYKMNNIERENMGNNGREYVMKNYTMDIIGKKYLELYKIIT
jgi:glycosyltransferase involved in cell wall biosynthesis